MRLALRLGRTLSELRHSLSVSEAMMWMEFDRVSPLGDERGDIRNAQIVISLIPISWISFMTIFTT